MNFHQILGLRPGASAAEIKKAYRQLARKHHPDVNPNDPNAAAKFIEIQEAYEQALAQKMGKVNSSYAKKQNQSTRGQAHSYRSKEQQEIYRFISNLEQICIRRAQVSYWGKAMTPKSVVKNYLRGVWSPKLVESIKQHASPRQIHRITELHFVLMPALNWTEGKKIISFLKQLATSDAQKKYLNSKLYANLIPRIINPMPTLMKIIVAPVLALTAFMLCIVLISIPFYFAHLIGLPVEIVVLLALILPYFIRAGKFIKN